ncbi:MAG: DinB family protein [Treponema sp.]|nr:DinB family protein [Treponema sp.]
MEKVNIREWNTNQKNLFASLSNEKTFNNGISLLIKMHSSIHDKTVYKNTTETIFNKLLENLKDETYKIISKKETSILWNIWHITRIEDIVSNLLIGNKETIFNTELQKKLNIKIKDTGNVMTYSEIEMFNKNISIKELLKYRNNIGKSTKKIIEKLKNIDMKRKVEKSQLENIKLNGGIVNDSMWLLDFWGKKNILGLIMMPITRHQIIHINDCFNIKLKYNKK